MALILVDEYPSKGSRNRVSSGVDTVLHSYDDRFNISEGDKDGVSPQNEGTVWDLIPDIKQSLYPHQQAGFKFIWTNLARTMNLHNLKTADPSSAGGCIISHAPGTGKTRLTIVFLQTYLEVFPKCRPVIIAPAIILRTWEDEFKKWNIGVPFHNLNTPELSGKEHIDATNEVDCSGSPHKNKDAVRMAKLYSWFKEKSILGISYQLFEKLAGGNSKKKNRNMRKEKKHASMKENPEPETSVLGKVLLEVPGLLVLDEGHTPRNQRSSIWNVLSRIQTQKRIILSGTPFQNNFVELYNTLCLVKPSFPDMIPPELKKFCQSRLMQERKASQDFTWEQVSPGNITTGNPSDVKIKQLKGLMDPFVHVHKGSILQENLPGLRDCVLILKPGSLEKEILESIECSQSTFNFERKLALASVHPWLFLCCTLTKKEKSVVDRYQLERLQLSPHEGAKTRFLVEFVRLCDSVGEKVLVFSQFIDPLKLIMDQLKSHLKWDEGKEVLYMSGELGQKKKQHLIHGFNSEDSQAKVLLASTNACSEGINLVGASRVVLLDVVWNPSVERQAISRAYRLGQKKFVYTYHLITQDTAEFAKYCKQAEKDRLSELVFSAQHAEDDKTKIGAVNLNDKVLDTMIEHEKLKDLFVKCVVQPKERDLIKSPGS
ncbi:SNF2 domain-containing protein CLASSY 3-like [Lotus japonicus]|uniref:SNF2 domain-containing protein CLASSY 3-like n=1 Tax=Lotus japonicus TaxID=34305 RepID=UPI002584208A|nr:SNF2 domain-containing protein CLASSY 3-like [Lotus japonicus]